MPIKKITRVITPERIGFKFIISEGGNTKNAMVIADSIEKAVVRDVVRAVTASIKLAQPGMIFASTPHSTVFCICLT